MKATLRRITVAAVVVLAATLAVGAAAASAHGPRPGGHLLGVPKSALVTEAAKQLNVARSSVVAAIRKSANVQIDAAREDGDIDADRAALLRNEVEDNLSFAYRLSRASQVAANLGITTAKLNDEFRDARRALALARIDRALANGRITAAQAAELKRRLEDADLPGYKGFGLFGFGGHRR